LEDAPHKRRLANVCSADYKDISTKPLGQDTPARLVHPFAYIARALSETTFI
jgi:hypothetical protein